MRCLSLTQPWAWSMMSPDGPKEIENRTWPAEFMVGETFAMHASAKWDPHGEAFLLERGVLVPPKHALPKSCILGTVKMERCIERAAYDLMDEGRRRELVPADQEQYFFGPFGFYLPKATRRLITPLPHPGMLGFFELPEDVTAEVISRLTDKFPDTLPVPMPVQQAMPWEPPGGLQRPSRKPSGRGRR